MTTMNENNNNNATILLVDNEPDNTCILSICLEDEGFKVDAFNDPVLASSARSRSVVPPCGTACTSLPSIKIVTTLQAIS